MKFIITLAGPLLLLSLTSCESVYQQETTRLQSNQARAVAVKLTLCPRIQASEALIAKDKERAYENYNIKLTAAQQKELLAIYQHLEIRPAKKKPLTPPIHDSYGYIATLDFYDAAGASIDSLDPKWYVYSDIEERTESGQYRYLPYQYERRMRKIYCDALNASGIMSEPVQPSSLRQIESTHHRRPHFVEAVTIPT